MENKVGINFTKLAIQLKEAGLQSGVVEVWSPVLDEKLAVKFMLGRYTATFNVEYSELVISGYRED